LGGLGEKTASPDKEQNGDKENDQILAVHGFLSFWQPKVSSRTALVKIPDFSKAISKAWEHIRDCGVSIRLEKDDVRRQTHFHPLYPRAARFPLPGDLPVPRRYPTPSESAGHRLPCGKTVEPSINSTEDSDDGNCQIQPGFEDVPNQFHGFAFLHPEEG
jgi:hypothetical protein